MELIYKTHVRWDEIDAMGHVNHINYLKWVQEARVEVCKANGTATEYHHPTKAPIIASISVDYHKQVHFPDDIIIKSSITDIGNTSFKEEHLIYNGENELVAIVKDVLVYVDYSTGTKISIPEAIRNKMKLQMK